MWLSSSLSKVHSMCIVTHGLFKIGGMGARKEILALWKCKALKHALIVENIQVGFRRMGIYPFNPSAMDCNMGPASEAQEVGEEEHALELPGEEAIENIPIISIEDPNVPYNSTHYLVQVDDSEEEGELHFPSSQDTVGSQEQPGSPGCLVEIPRVLTLPTLPVRNSRLPSTEPIVDYSKSILLILDSYLTQIEQLAAKRSDAARSRDARKLATEE
jgi:hypothetical protein